MSAPVVYMDSPQLAGCDVWLKDGTHVIFTDGGEGNQRATNPRPRPPQPAMQEAFQRAWPASRERYL